MGAAIGDILGLAAGVAVSPLPIVAMILVLATPRGRGNGILFGVGWLAGLRSERAALLLGEACGRRGWRGMPRLADKLPGGALGWALLRRSTPRTPP